MIIRKWFVIGGTAVLAVLLTLLLAVGLTQAQAPTGAEEAGEEAGTRSNVYSYVPVQGRLTDANGDPLPDGYYYVTFRLYGSSTGDDLRCADTNSVGLENGLFYSEISTCSTLDIDGRQLYLGIEVEDDGEMMPLQPIYPVPYAITLKPGSVISGTRSDAIVHIENSYAGGRGLRAYATNTSSTNYAVIGASKSPNGYGGYFYNTADGFAVSAIHSGYNANDISGWARPAGYFGGNIGVIGFSKDVGGIGVLGQMSDATGWAGMFTGIGNGVRISVPVGKVGLEVIDGTKNAVVRTDDGDRLLYTEESSEVWFSDYGFGALQDGMAVIAIDPLFAQTVNLEEPYHVFVQVYGDAEVYVSDRTPTGFSVRLRDGEPDIEFSYRIVGKRLGYEDHRLELSPGVGETMHYSGPQE